MVKKKRKHPDVEEVLARPWCFYCERDFDDLKILISHQKAKHFKCERCGRRLNTAGGLSVHMNQVHKETLNSVDNALPNRANLDVEIFGMEGIPEDVINSHNQRMVQQFYEAEAERRKTSGNPAPGSNADKSAPKKPKTEELSDLKKRLAEHRAKKAAQQAGQNSGNVTPLGAGQAASPPGAQTPSLAPPGGSPYGSAAVPHPNTHASPPPMQQFQTPGTASFSQQPPAFQQPPLHPAQSHMLSNQAPYTSAAPPGSMPLPGGQQYAFTAGSPPSMQTGTNLPIGLPQRPAFANTQPPPNLQSMPFGQASSLPGSGSLQAPSESSLGTNGQGNGYAAGMMMPQKPSNAPGVSASAPGTSTADAGTTSTGKKSGADAPAADKKAAGKKDKPTRLVYSDNDVSPEEKMAALPRYAVEPNSKRKKDEENVLGTVAPAVTGIAVGPDDVIDKQG